MGAEIKTAKIANHRKLRLESVDAALAEIDRIVSAEREGRLQGLGNWTPGQIMSHVAAWIEYGYHGFPMKPPPFFIRWILKLQVKKFLRNGMPRGVRIPRVEAGTFGTEDISTGEGADRLRAALKRLESREEVKYPSPAFGDMPHDDRVLFNLRHAELHLGFLDY